MSPAGAEVDIDARFRVLEPLMRSAGRIALEGFRSARLSPPTMKGPQDFLTETDAAVERHLRTQIAAAFPGDGFVGEEEGGEGGAVAWVADPIDGTANFARGNAHFCISLALVVDGRIELGAIHAPVSGELWLARRGGGATLDGRPVAVARTADPSAATVELGWSPRVPNEVYLDMAAAILGMGANIRRTGSGALGLAFVADGRQDAYTEMHINAWDCLAGILLVTEGGGRVNDFLSGDGFASGNPILATAPGIADAMERATGFALLPAGRPAGRSAA